MKVNQNVIQILNKMTHLTPKERKQLETVVCRYSKPKTFSDTLSYIAYRIANAVKSIFGQSDRQIAIRTIGKEGGTDKFSELKHKKELLKKVKASGIKSKALQERVHNRLFPIMSQIFSGTNNAIFDHLINLNNGMSLEVAEKISEKKMEWYWEKAKMETKFIKKSFGIDLS